MSVVYKNRFLAVIIFIFITSLPSYAYLDPGTGSMVVQVIIAAIAGAIYWIKIKWNDIKGFFKNICSKKK